MRAVFPILFVILGIGIVCYANGRLPGGLADADLAAVAELAREGAVDLLDRAYPDWRDSRHGRSALRHRHLQSLRIEPSSRKTTVRTRYRVREGVSLYQREQPVRRRAEEGASGSLRGFRQRDRSADSNQPFEIVFVVPAQKKAEAAERMKGEAQIR